MHYGLAWRLPSQRKSGIVHLFTGSQVVVFEIEWTTVENSWVASVLLFASILSNCVSIILNLDISIDCSQFPIFFIISSGSSAYRYGRPPWSHSPRVMSRFHLIQDGRPCITQSARSRPSYNNNNNTKSFICMTIKELQYCKSYLFLTEELWSVNSLVYQRFIKRDYITLAKRFLR